VAGETGILNEITVIPHFWGIGIFLAEKAEYFSSFLGNHTHI
jgi:hypothetical protein